MKNAGDFLTIGFIGTLVKGEQLWKAKPLKKRKGGKIREKEDVAAHGNG